MRSASSCSKSSSMVYTCMNRTAFTPFIPNSDISFLAPSPVASKMPSFSETSILPIISSIPRQLAEYIIYMPRIEARIETPIKFPLAEAQGYPLIRAENLLKGPRACDRFHSVLLHNLIRLLARYASPYKGKQDLLREYNTPRLI